MSKAVWTVNQLHGLSQALFLERTHFPLYGQTFNQKDNYRIDCKYSYETLKLSMEKRRNSFE